MKSQLTLTEKRFPNFPANSTPQKSHSHPCHFEKRTNKLLIHPHLNLEQPTRLIYENPERLKTIKIEIKISCYLWFEDEAIECD
jgi:hypothetical protein